MTNVPDKIQTWQMVTPFTKNRKKIKALNKKICFDNG